MTKFTSVVLSKIQDDLLVPTEMNAKSRRIIAENVKLAGKNPKHCSVICSQANITV